MRDEILGMLDELQVGDALPSERRLAQDLKRLAADAARRDRRAGPRGPAAAPPRQRHLRRGAEDRAAADDDLVQRGHGPARDAPVAAASSASSVQSAGAKLGQRLQISPVDEVWVITRLRLADDETMAIEWLHAPRRLLPELRREELATHSFYELLRVRRGITIASGTQTIEPTVTSPEEAELLGVPVHSPGVPLRADHPERRRGGGGVRPVRVPRGPVPAGDGASPGAPLGAGLNGRRPHEGGRRGVTLRRPLRTGDAPIIPPSGGGERER